MDEMNTGGRDGAERPVRPALSREYIIHTTLKIIDRDGLDSLSMRKLGAELEVDPMAVYYHIPNKAALFDGVVEALYREILDFHPPATGGWREHMLGFMRRMRDVLRQHPNAVPIIATRPAYTPAILEFGEQALSQSQEFGMSAREMLIVVNCVRAFTVGHVIAEIMEPIGGPTATPEEALAITVDKYPNLAKAIVGGYQPDEQFEQGLNAILSGFETMLP